MNTIYCSRNIWKSRAVYICTYFGMFSHSIISIFLMSNSFSFAVISPCLSLALTLSSRFHLTRQLRNTRRPKRFVCCRFFYMFCQSIIQSVEWKWYAIMYFLYIYFAYVMEYKKERCVMCVYIYICARLYLSSYTCKLCCMHVYVFLCVYI